MKHLSYVILFSITLILSGFKTFDNSEWKLKEDYSIKFISDNPEGIFKELSGNIVFDEGNLEGSSFNMEIDASSISTGNGMKNKHAISDKWFDVDNHPKIIFQSTNITKDGDEFRVVGSLNIHGVEKQIDFPFSFEDDVFSGSFDIDRTEFNLGPTSGMQGNKASKILKVEIRVPVTKK